MGIPNSNGKRTRYQMNFDKILESQQITTAQATNWFRETAMKLNMDPKRIINSDNSRRTRIPLIGNLYLFQYDPKYKETLSYYDRFPLVFPFQPTRKRGYALQEDGFFGINVHYLPPRLRARLMNNLYQYVTGDLKETTSSLQISYNILINNSKTRFFKPCVKHYLLSNMRSKLFRIQPEEWNTAIMMPLQRFTKASQGRVWSESIGRI